MGHEVPVQEARFLIVGGGVTGLSAAQAAAATVARVLLLEAGAHLGLGASGRNAGIVSVGANLGLSDLPPDSSLAALWPATTNAANSLFHAAAQPDAIIQARQTGALSLARATEEVRWLTTEAEARRAAGLRAEVWTSAQSATDGFVKAGGATLKPEDALQSIHVSARLLQVLFKGLPQVGGLGGFRHLGKSFDDTALGVI